MLLILLEPVNNKKLQSWVKSFCFNGKVLVLGGKFQALLLDNYPGRFGPRQVVVLPHAFPIPEFSGIIFCNVWQDKN